MNDGPLRAFVTPRAVLDPEWMDYISDFDLVLSYFYDPDGLFKENIERCKPGELLASPPRVPGDFSRPAAPHRASSLPVAPLRCATRTTSLSGPSDQVRLLPFLIPFPEMNILFSRGVDSPRTPCAGPGRCVRALDGFANINEPVARSATATL